MVSKELKKNSVNQLIFTLSYLASYEEQVHYKESVPYVHVTIELVEQWNEHVRKLKTQEWFSELFSKKERESFVKLYWLTELFINKYRSDIPDTDEVQIVEEWIEVMKFSKIVLDLILENHCVQ